MIELRRGPRLAKKASAQVRIAGERWREKLERNAAMELRILGEKHFPHAAGTDLLQDAVMPNLNPHGGEVAGESLIGITIRHGDPLLVKETRQRTMEYAGPGLLLQSL